MYISLVIIYTNIQGGIRVTPTSTARLDSALGEREVAGILRVCETARGTSSRPPITFAEIEALATLPALLAVLTELQEGQPQLVQCTVFHEAPAAKQPAAIERAAQNFGVLHSQRERSHRDMTFHVRPPGRISPRASLSSRAHLH